MFPAGTGVSTLKTRVEAWECDFNGHWNTRFYMRSFQQALEVACHRSRSGHGGAKFLTSRHCRFHRELISGDAPTVYSHVMRGGDQDGWIAHFMICDGLLAATALDQWTGPAIALPEITPENAPLALPRGLTGNGVRSGIFDPASDRGAELGAVAPNEFDHGGTLLLENLMRRFSVASHDHIVAAGYTNDFTRRTGIGRMLVECRLDMLASCPPGSCLHSLSRFGDASRKSFGTLHGLFSDETPVAHLEMCLVAVDMHTRRATGVPEFVVSQARADALR